MTFLIPVAVPLIAGSTTAGLGNWFNSNRHEN
jgi:hypothetical protein